MVGSGWDTFKIWWAVVQDDVTGGEEVGLTSALLLDDLSLQVLHDAAMLPMVQLSLKDPMGLDLTDGFGTGGLGFLDHMVVLAFLTAVEEVVLASKVSWEQVT